MIGEWDCYLVVVDRIWIGVLYLEEFGDCCRVC